MKISKAISWDELADIYDKKTGAHARTLDMNQVFRWAERQGEKFFMSEEGTLHKIIQK